MASQVSLVDVIQNNFCVLYLHTLLISGPLNTVNREFWYESGTNEPGLT